VISPPKSETDWIVALELDVAEPPVPLVRADVEVQPTETAPLPYDQPFSVAPARGGADTPAAEPPSPSGRTTRTPVARAEAAGPLWAAAGAPTAKTTTATIAAWRTRWATTGRLSAPTAA
jgi:hypothetical protein